MCFSFFSVIAYLIVFFDFVTTKPAAAVRKYSDFSGFGGPKKALRMNNEATNKSTFLKNFIPNSDWDKFNYRPIFRTKFIHIGEATAQNIESSSVRHNCRMKASVPSCKRLVGNHTDR